MFHVLAIDHTPALVVLVTEDEETAFRCAVKYATQQDSRVVVTKPIHNEPITREQASMAHAKYLADDQLKAAALAVEAAENNARIAALLELPPAVGVATESPSSDDDGKRSNAAKRR